MSTLILASGSNHRALLLQQAGLSFGIERADLDERELEAPLVSSGASPEDVALVLATAKAEWVSNINPDKYVIGCDQTLELEGNLLHKPEDMEAARRRLLQLSGKVHTLNSAIAIVRNGEVLWQFCEPVFITFRKLSPGEIGKNLAMAGNAVLSSVGAYQIEGVGIQLFEKIEGDYFSAIGLPLLALLAKLRDLGITTDPITDHNE